MLTLVKANSREVIDAKISSIPGMLREHRKVSAPNKYLGHSKETINVPLG